MKNKIEITKGKLIAWLVGNIFVILAGLWWLSGLSKQVEILTKQQDNIMQVIMKAL